MDRTSGRLLGKAAISVAVVAAGGLALADTPARSNGATSVGHSGVVVAGSKDDGGRVLHDVPAGVVNGGMFTIAPTRLADTRPAPDAKGNTRRLGANSSADFTVAGAGAAGVPSSAVAVVMNVTAVSPSAAGFLTLFPAGGARPTVSNVNFVAGQIVPNLVQVKLGTGGAVTVFNGSTGSTDVILDVLGYYAPGGAAFQPQSQRFTDRTMNGGTTFVGTSPSTVNGRRLEAFALNLTVDKPSDDGFLVVRPAGASTGTSNLNFLAGQTRANAAITGLNDAVDASGRPLRSEEYEIAPQVRSARVVVDEMGVFLASNGTTAGNFVPLTPCRLGDTRAAPDQTGNLTTRVSSAATVALEVAGRCGLPADPKTIDSIAVNVTAVNPSNDGFFRLWRADSAETTTSSVNFLAGQVVANHAIVETSLTGTVGVRLSTGTADLVVDVFGYYAV